MNIKDKANFNLLYEKTLLERKFNSIVRSLPIEEQVNILNYTWHLLDESQKEILKEKGLWSTLSGIGSNLLGNMLSKLSTSTPSATTAPTPGSTAAPTTQATSTGIGGILGNIIKSIPPETIQNIIQQIIQMIPIEKIQNILQSVLGGQNTPSTASAPVKESVETVNYIIETFNNLEPKYQQSFINDLIVLEANLFKRIGKELGRGLNKAAPIVGTFNPALGALAGAGGAALRGKNSQEVMSGGFKGFSGFGGKLANKLYGAVGNKLSGQAPVTNPNDVNSLIQSVVGLSQSNPDFTQQLQGLISKYMPQR